MGKDETKDRGFLGGIFLSYLVLLLHGLLVLLLGVAVVFFRGVVEYMGWILGGGLALIALSGYLFYRRIRKQGLSLRESLNDPVLRDRPLEISFLGGVASVRLGRPSGAGEAVLPGAATPVHQIESPENQRLRDMARLVKLLDEGLINPQEYEQLKKDLLSGPTMAGPVH